MDIHELIRTRRSVRRFTDEPVKREQLLKVLEALRWAPSWVNYQPWEVIVVEDPAVRERLQECVTSANPGRRAVTQAPVLLAVCGRTGISGTYDGQVCTTHGDWVMFDLGIACEHVCLAAWELGLGSLHLGLMDQEAAREVLSLPDGVNLYELIPLGVPARESRPTPRKELSEFTHRDRFGVPFDA